MNDEPETPDELHERVTRQQELLLQENKRLHEELRQQNAQRKYPPDPPDPTRHSAPAVASKPEHAADVQACARLLRRVLLSAGLPPAKWDRLRAEIEHCGFAAGIWEVSDGH